jgi:pimeloyl-ACP methyl ester carboxylesterase
MDKEHSGTDSLLTRRTLLTGLLVAGVVSCAAPGEESGDRPASSDRALLGHKRRGNGSEPVVVLHEWMGDHTNYDLVQPFLPEDTYSWVFADLRGYGLSKSMGGAYTLQEAADDVIRLMDSYGYKRFHVVGHSMSGMIAQYIAKIGGSRVKSVVAISPVPASGFRANAETMKTLMAIIDDDAAARAAILARGGSRYGRGWQDRKLIMTRRASNRDAMIGYLTMFTGSDVSNEVRGTTTPVTAVCGEYDLPLYREDSIRKLLGPLFPNLEVVVSHEAGHYSMLETPPLLAGQIEKGIARGV